MDFGSWVEKGVPGHQVRAIVDLLESRGYLKILLNPKLETVNGKPATVTIQDWAPYETTGELLTWCAEQRIEAIDIVIPDSLSGSDRNLRDATMKALSEIALFP